MVTSAPVAQEPTVMQLLLDAGEDVKRKLGANLDPYESIDSTRII